MTWAFSNLSRDLVYAARGMRKNTALTVAIVFTVAVGIGANTAIFSAVHAVLLKPLGYYQPDQLVVLNEGVTPVRFQEMLANSRSYSDLGAFAVGAEEIALSGVAEPEVLKGARVSANFLHILGVSPWSGRSFVAEEDKPAAPAVAMISAELWHRRFGGNSSIVGKPVTLGGIPHTIVGVLPPGFQFPTAGTDVWLTRPAEWSAVPPESRRISPILSMFGRLQPNASLQQANAEMAVLKQQYAAAHPGMLDGKPNQAERILRLKDELISDARPKLWMLFGAVGLVLLIVCANMASLLLARATSRAKEFAVRTAIGATRGQIVRQLLVESLMLASVGGFFGIVLAAFSLRAMRSFLFIDLPRSGEIRMDPTVLGFAVAACVVTGLLFGLVPSLAASRPDLAAVLKGSGEAGSRQWSGRVLRFEPRRLLVVAQVALSLVLLISATLLIESLSRLYRVNPGFRTDNLLTMSIALPPVRYDTQEKRAAFYDALVQRIQSVPGVRSAAITLTLPMTGFAGSPVQVAGRPPLALNERPISIFQEITAGYFRTLQIALKRGRDFTAHDNKQSARVAIINESLARLFWPQYPAGPDPVGQRILFGTEPEPIEIVGIAADVHETGRDEEPRPGIYFPCNQRAPQSAMLAVRTAGDPLSFANVVRSQVSAIDPDEPVSAISTMEELDEASAGQLRLMMRLLAAFAVAATVLAMIGVYGVISYWVAQRTREIGIRSALGAQPLGILRLVLGQGLALSLTGILLGVCGAFWATRLLQDLLFRVSATDPVTFAGLSALFVVVTLGAAYIPARRAAAIEPLTALRAS
ncbi:MAG TPA: ABC transporter permease [Terriglobales bacterium]|nr:ABC transporter permease [Terriglobales bacterium]